MKASMAETELGLPKNTLAALAYLLGWFSGVAVLFLSKDRAVRFHAMQSVVVFGVLTALSVLPVIKELTLGLVPLFWLVLMLVLMYKASTGEEWEVPVVGKIVRGLLERM